MIPMIMPSMNKGMPIYWTKNGTIVNNIYDNIANTIFNTHTIPLNTVGKPANTVFAKKLTAILIVPSNAMPHVNGLLHTNPLPVGSSDMFIIYVFSLFN